MIPSRLVLATALTAASALVLAGCAGASSLDDGTVRVVASTNVYGQIAQAIGGDAVEVTAIIDSAAQDPHSFEPSAQDQLAVSRAELLLENGGGYDAFLDALIESSGTDALVLTAAEFSPGWPADADHDDEHGEHGHAHVEGFNEHVWYDPHTMAAFADAIAGALTDLAPESASSIAANLADFTDGIDRIEAALAAVAATDAGAEVFVTEPVPLYLVAEAGLVDVAPPAFTEAVEEGQDVPPATLLAAREVLAAGGVRVVVTNAQTGGAETEDVVREAENRGIPVVTFAETLPEGQTYLSWMDANVAALAEALHR